MRSLWTRQLLATQLSELGLSSGDAVLVHAGLRSVGPILGGPDTLIDAMIDVTGRDGTILAYCDWQCEDEILLRPELRDQIPPFDPAASRAIRDNGAFPELLRTRPGARRSANPGASCAALGGRADWFTGDHVMNYGYGPNSPFGKLVLARGKTMLIGAPFDTMTLLHHAEHLADIVGKRIRRYESPTLVEGATVWRTFEEFDTSEPVVDGLQDDYFSSIVSDFLALGHGNSAKIGDADTILVEAAAVVAFAVDWLERKFPR